MKFLNVGFSNSTSISISLDSFCSPRAKDPKIPIRLTLKRVLISLAWLLIMSRISIFYPANYRLYNSKNIAIFRGELAPKWDVGHVSAVKQSARRARLHSRAQGGGEAGLAPRSRAHAKARSREVPMSEGQFLPLWIFALTDDAWSGRPSTWPIISGTGILGATIEKYSARASTDSQVALISLGADCAVGVVGKTCIGVPTRLIYSLKSWIDKSFIKRFK